MTDLDRAAHYEIRVEGTLDCCWEDWFDGFRVRNERSETVLSGPLIDQAALHGVLAKIRDLGLCLISAQRLDSK